MPQLFTPQLLGLPPKFQNYFPGQEEAIGSIINSTSRFDVLPASTGFGKSATYFSIASFFAKTRGWRSCILTANRGLQDQNQRDFEKAGLVDIRGMRNYDCIAMNKPGGEFFPFYLEYVLERGYFPKCDEGPCLAGYKCPHRLFPAQRGPCDYFGQVEKAAVAKIRQSNYAYHIRAGRGAQATLPPADLLILDEAHEAPNELSRALTLNITANELRRVHLSVPSNRGNYDWSTWGKKVEIACERRGESLKARGRPLSYARDVRQLSDLAEKSIKLQKRSADWVFQYDPRGALKWEPLQPGPYAELNLFQGAKKVILASASVGEKHLELLNIDPANTSWHRAPNAFSPGRRPVIFCDVYPRLRLKWPYRADTLDMMVARIDHAISMRLYRKGIIHCISYDLGQQVKRRSRYADLFITPQKDTEGATKAAVHQFKQAEAPRLLLSPAVYEGYDFPDDECRYQIILKLAFPRADDLISAARQERDPEYKCFMAMMHLVQAVGRGMRNVTDWCETLIFDDQIVWLMSRYSHLAPDWFTAAYRISKGFPEKLNPGAA